MKKILVLIIVVILIISILIAINILEKNSIENLYNSKLPLYTAEEVEINFAKTNDERILEALDKNMAQAYATELGSADSLDEAYEMVTDVYNQDKNNLISMELLFENDKIYLIECEFETRRDSETDLIKRKVYDYLIYKSDYYDTEMNCIYDKDINSLKESLDFIFYTPKVAKEEIKQVFNFYIYEKYFYTVVGGDWGLPDRVTYKKMTIKINKNNGKISKDTEEIMEFESN